MERINEEVSKGTTCYFQVINAKSYVPQRRERILLFALIKKFLGAITIRTYLSRKSPLKEVVWRAFEKARYQYMSDKL